MTLELLHCYSYIFLSFVKTASVFAAALLAPKEWRWTVYFLGMALLPYP
jgi:hypothetical protein